MSSASHDKFLLKLHQEMEKSSQTYRTSVSDKKRHVFTYSAKDVRDALKVLLNLEENIGKKKSNLKDFAGNSSTFQKEYRRLVSTLTQDLRKDFHAKAKEGVILVDNIREGVVVIAYEFGDRSNYDLIKDTYKGHLDNFYTEFLKLLTSPLTRPTGRGKKRRTKELQEASDVFNLGHEEGGSNIEHMMNDAVHSALSFGFGSTALTSAAKKAIKKRLGNSEAAASIFKVYQAADDGIIRVSLEGAWQNYTKGGSDEQQLNRDLTKVLRGLNLAELEGSDSLTTGQRKKLVKALVEPYVKQKGVKIKHENTKPSGRSTKEFKHKPKVTAGESRSLGIKKAAIAARRKAKRRPAAPRMSLNNILGILNNRLPETVADAMGDPRLENRTGRFAQSVRATDVTETRQGFPSIGYTYMRQPYGVFESTSGTKFADINRDPRPLIDQSIREIALGLGLGRIYTRRQ